MISIVVPIYNEEECLNSLYSRLTSASNSYKDDYEIILVDDGSRDRSLEIMTEFAKKDSHLKIVKLSRNFGHQPAISAGIQVANGDAVVIMDGDLQDPPEELHRFLDKWREGFDVVYAIRTQRKENIFKRMAYSTFYRLLAWISDIHIPLDSGDFCVMDRKVVNVLVQEMPEQIRFVRGMRAYSGFKQVGLKYERAEREAGEVKYTLSKLFKLAMDGLFGFSSFPLRLATYLGFFISFISFSFGFYFIIARIFDIPIFGRSPKDVPGSATLTFGTYFLSGVILIILGILGEYIGRIYIEVKRRPFFVIDKVIQNKNPAD